MSSKPRLLPPSAFMTKTMSSKPRLLPPSAFMTLPDGYGNSVLLETPEEIAMYEKFLTDLRFEKYGESPPPESVPMPYDLFEKIDYRKWIDGLCKEKREVWTMNDSRLPGSVQRILGLWFDYYGNVQFGSKCKITGDRKKIPTGTMDFYLNCSHTKTIGKGDNFRKDITVAKNFFKHVHFVYDYKREEAGYIVKDYKFLPDAGDNDSRIINAYNAFRKPLELSESYTKTLGRKISERKAIELASQNFNIDLKSINNRIFVPIDLSDDPVKIVEEMHSGLDCTGDERGFKPSEVKKEISKIKFSQGIRPPKESVMRKQLVSREIAEALALHSSNPSV